MSISSEPVPPQRRRIAVPDRPRPWAGSSAQREWATSFQVVSWDRCSSDDYIRVLPYLMGAPSLHPCLLVHFANRLAPSRRVAAPRTFMPGWLAKRRVEVRAGSTGKTTARMPAATRAGLMALLDALRLGVTPSYEPQLAASLAFWIELHPAHVWEEAMISHEMFLTIGWLGLLKRRGGAWMPAAVAEYLCDVLEIDPSGHHHVVEPLLAELIADQDIRVAVAVAAEDRLRRDEAFLRWPTPVLNPSQA